MKYLARIKDYILRFYKKGLSPHEIATGIALGIFIGCVPMLGVHTIMAIGLASLLRLNTLVVLIGTQISNPISFPFQIFVSAEVGSLILNGHFLDIKFSRDINYLNEYILPIIIGGLVLGIILSMASYIVIKFFLKRRQVVE